MVNTATPEAAEAGAMSALKRLLKRTLPPALVLRIKMARHARRIGAATVDDELDFAPLETLVRPGDVVIDVGANMGWYTKFLSDLVGATGIVVSVEPVPGTLRILRHVVATLGLANVRIVPCAVSDTSGAVTMEIPRFADGERNIFEARIVAGALPGAETVQVETTTLDALAAPLGRPPALVKIDVEGHELPALRGAQQLLRTVRPAWLIEVWGDPDRTGTGAAATFELFAHAGYAPYWYDGKALRPRVPGETSVNYFFLTPEQAARAASGAEAKGAR